MWPQRAALAAPLLWSTFAINILGLALPLAVLQVYDRVLAESTPGRWLAILMGVLAAIAGESLLRLARAYTAGRMGSRREQQMTLLFLKHLFSAGPGNEGSGQHLHTLDALAKLREFSSGQAFTVLLEVPFALIYLALIGYLGGVLVLVPLGLLLVFGWREVNQGEKLVHRMAKRDRAEVVRQDALIEGLERLHSVKAEGRLRWLQRRLEKHHRIVAEASRPVVSVACKAYQDGLLFSQVMLAAVTMAGTPLVLSGEISLGALMACVLVSGRLTSPIQRGLGLYTRVQEARLARDRVQRVLTQPMVFGTATTPNDNHFAGSMELRRLGIKSASTGKWLLRQMQFQAGRGHTIALEPNQPLTGTLLMQTLAGLRPQNEGEVLINGVSPYLLASSELVRQVGYLPPQGTIYRGTIYDNLSRFGASTPEQVAEMIELLELEAAFSVLPRGLDTMLENTLADPLPPGLKQRVALARVLAAKPRVILFNQADRSLDHTGYNVVYRLLERLKGKVLMVLHSEDRNLLALADETWCQEGTVLRRRLHMDNSAAVYAEIRGGIAA